MSKMKRKRGIILIVKKEWVIKKRMEKELKGISFVEPIEKMIANVPKSALSDNYIEFGSGGRQTNW